MTITYYLMNVYIKLHKKALPRIVVVLVSKKKKQHYRGVR